ncbi:hypothetical protein V2J09_007619 [Rumex salicifolius]
MATMELPEKQEEKIREEEVKEEEKRRHFHVLAVDDSKLDRKILEQLLTVSSYQVTSVESGDKALEYLGLMDDSPLVDSSNHQGEGINVNLIMTDYSMPGMSGYDLLKKLKGSSWKDVPVVVMSSENVPSRIHMCLEEGAEEFLLKPVQLSDVKKLQPFITRSRTLNEEQQNNLFQENNIKISTTITSALIS